MDERIRAHRPKFSKEKFGRAHIFVSGRVQGVFFRSNTRKKAEELKVSGWIKNLSDSRVEAIFEGKKERVQDLIEWTKESPKGAEVNNVKVQWEEYKGEFRNFKIKYS